MRRAVGSTYMGRAAREEMAAPPLHRPVLEYVDERLWDAFKGVPDEAFHFTVGDGEGNAVHALGVAASVPQSWNVTLARIDTEKIDMGEFQACCTKIGIHPEVALENLQRGGGCHL